MRLVGNIVLRTMVSLWLDWYELPASKKKIQGLEVWGFLIAYI